VLINVNPFISINAVERMKGMKFKKGESPYAVCEFAQEFVVLCFDIAKKEAESRTLQARRDYNRIVKEQGNGL
jgi:hypothetical protein